MHFLMLQLFLCVLFNDAFSNTEYMYGVEIVELLINTEMETLNKEATAARCKLPSLYLTGRIEEIHDQSQ
jgi:hypothetical protein